ncbi:4523_t:CDS:2, partial [Acaulospora morrowiae]
IFIKRSIKHIHRSISLAIDESLGHQSSCLFPQSVEQVISVAYIVNYWYGVKVNLDMADDVGLCAHIDIGVIFHRCHSYECFFDVSYFLLRIIRLIGSR